MKKQNIYFSNCCRISIINSQDHFKLNTVYYRFDVMKHDSKDGFES